MSFESIAVFITGTWFTWIWCSLTVAYFLFFEYKLVMRARVLRLQLSDLIKTAEAAPPKAAFASAFEALDRQFRKIDLVRHSWPEFVGTLVLPEPSDPVQVVRNTREPSQFFNSDSIISPSIDLRFYSSVPNHLTGFGILGTFVGLACGINLGASRLGGEKAEEVIEALKVLLGGASLAFWTSVFGVFLSIVFLLSERLLISKLVKQVGQFQEALESRLEFLTVESIAAQQLAEARQQTHHLRKFNTDLAVSIADALDERLAGRMGPQFTKLIEVVEAMTATRSDSTERLVKDIVDQFSSTLSSNAGEHASTLSTTLVTLNASLQRTLSAVEESTGQSQGAISAISQQMSSSMETMAVEVGDLVRLTLQSASDQLSVGSAGMSAAISEAGESVAARMNETVARFEEQFRTFEETMTANRQLAGDLVGVARHIQFAGNTFGEMPEKLSGIVEPLASVATVMRQSSMQLVGAAEKISGLVTSIQESTAAQRDSLEKASSVWGNYEARFEGIDTSLAEVFGQIEGGLTRYTEQVKRFAAELDDKTGSAIQLLGGVIHELQGAVEDLNDALEKRP